MTLVPVTVRSIPLTNAFFELYLDQELVAAVTSIGAIKSSIAANPSKSGTQLHSVYSPGAVTYEALEIKQAQVLDIVLLKWMGLAYDPISAGKISIDEMKKNIMIKVNDSQMRPRIQHELYACLPTSIAWDALDSNAEANTFLSFTLQYEYSLTKYLEA